MKVLPRVARHMQSLQNFLLPFHKSKSKLREQSLKTYNALLHLY